MNRVLGFVSILLVTVSVHAAGVSKSSTDGLPAEAKEVLAETQGVTAEGKSEAAAPVLGMGANASLKESEVPLNLDKKKQSAEDGSPLVRVVMGLFILAVLGAGGVYYLRRHAKPGLRKNAPQIKVLNQHWLGPKKSLAIIRVAGESILIGVTDQNITMIKSLALMDDEVPVETPDQFGTVLAQKDYTHVETKTTSSVEVSEGEEFQFSGLNQIKDVVHRRLKGMRSLQ